MNIQIRKSLFVLLLGMMLPFAALAQTIDIRGVVVDSADEPIVGAVVKVKGTTMAVNTNIVKISILSGLMAS